MKKELKKPMVVRIDRNFNADSKRLYKQEHQRDQFIQACAKTWMKIMDVDDGEFWTVGVPQALFDALQSFQIDCSVAAAKAFLEQHGYDVREVK